MTLRCGCGCGCGCGFGQWIQRYLAQHELGFCSLMAGTSFIVFMALLPLMIDPSILTFVLRLEPASCLTVYSAALSGTSNCTWTSCQEGCTVDIYKCWHVNVSYLLANPAHPSMDHLMPYQQARLYPNVLGCGYPPDVDCALFYSSYAHRSQETFPCFVSLSDPTVAVIHADRHQAAVNLSIGFAPLAVCIVLSLYVSLRMRCQRRQRARARAKAGLSLVDEQAQRTQETKLFLESRKQSWLNAFRQDRISSASDLSSAAPSPSPTVARIQLHHQRNTVAAAAAAAPSPSPSPSAMTSAAAITSQLSANGIAT